MADALTPEQLEVFRQMRELPGGLWDAGKTVARGALGQVAGGYAGLFDLMRGRGVDAAANRVRDIEEGTRRDPETKAGQAVLQRVGETIEPVSTALKENIADPVGKVSPLLGAALVALPEALPGPKGAKSAAEAARVAAAGRVAERRAARVAEMERGPRPEGSEPLPGSTLDIQRQRAERLAQLRSELAMAEQPGNRAIVQRDIDRLTAEDTPRVVEALRARPQQDTLPGVEPRTRAELLREAEGNKRQALERMNFEDTNRGVNFTREPGGQYRLSEEPGPEVPRADPRWRYTTRADRPTSNPIEGWQNPPDVTAPRPEHTNFRRNVGDENAQRILEKRENLEGARTDLETARAEHTVPIAKEEIDQRTYRIEQLRDEASRTRDPEEMRRLEREILTTMRDKPLLVGPESDRQVYRALPLGPRSTVRTPGYADAQGYEVNLSDAATGPRSARLEAQSARLRDVTNLDELSEGLYEQMRADRDRGGRARGDQVPGWVRRLEERNPGSTGVSEPGATVQAAQRDWWQNNPDVIAKHGEVPKPPPPPLDPNAYNARTVNAFLRESSKNPAMFEYGPNPKATDLRGIADEMAASRGGVSKTKGEPVEVTWHGEGDEPGPGKRGHLKMKVGDLGEISADFDPRHGAHILATQGGDVGALLYQALNNHAVKSGYKISGDNLFRVNQLRVGTNILAEGARSGGELVNPRNMTGTSHGTAPKPRGTTSMAEVWQAEQASARQRIKRGAPEDLTPEAGVTGGDPYAVRFHPDEGFSIKGERVEGAPDRAINARIDELSPGLVRKDQRKPNSTGVGAKTLKRNAVYEWLQTAKPKEAREVAKNWKKYGSLFSAAGVSVGEILKAANDAEEQGEM